MLDTKFQNITIIRTLLIICLTTLIACSKVEDRVWYYTNGQVEKEAQYQEGKLHGKVVEYYSSGEVKSVGFFKHGKREGKLKVYYENGNTMSIISYQGGIMDDTAKHYYENGTVKQVVPFKNGYPNGWILFYSPKGKLTKKQEYFSYDNEKHMNQYIVYDEEGNINIDSSMYITLVSDKDTVNLGEPYKLSVKLETPMLGKNGQMEVQVGDFDEEYRLGNNSMPDTVKSKNYVSTVILEPEKRGKHRIRGRVVNYRMNDSLDEDPSWIKEEIHIYFTKEYQVK